MVNLPVSISLAKFLAISIPSLIAVAYLTLLERKVLGVVAYRPSPNKVSLGGILQPISDAVKLGNKQSAISSNTSSLLYYMSSCFMLSSALVIWCCFFCDPAPVYLAYPLLVLMMVLAFVSLNSIFSGWVSFSKFSLLGGMRTVSQLISYESCLYMCFFFILFLFGSFEIMQYKLITPVFVMIPMCFYFWWPSMLAELNRTPYDFSEGESELVSGFNTEYGSNSFTLIFLSEYSNILFFSLLTCSLFFSSDVLWVFVSVVLLVVWIRCVLPRYRFDKLMSLSWKFIIPFLTSLFLCYLTLF